jgi:nucleotidyltransferase/DNA polymerase involved in DNA repair
MQSSTQKRAIIHITAKGEKTLRINYSRRMYAIIRRYTPEVVEGNSNQCYAELTGLRTFFKMTYAEMVKSILRDLTKEIGVSFTMRVATGKEYDAKSQKTKKQKSVSTYNEINRLFAGRLLKSQRSNSHLIHSHSPKKIKLTVPYIGKVS